MSQPDCPFSFDQATWSAKITDMHGRVISTEHVGTLQECEAFVNRFLELMDVVRDSIINKERVVVHMDSAIRTKSIKKQSTVTSSSSSSVASVAHDVPAYDK
jgi:hypothetical protein